MKTARRIFQAMMICALMAGFSFPAFATVEWEAGITVKVKDAGNKLNLGQKADATDGFDPKYEVPAMLAGDVSAYFTCGGKKVWRDIKGTITDSVKEWDMSIESPLTGETVTVSWDRNAMPDGLTLTDLSAGVEVNMKNRDSYRYKNTGPRKFIVQIKEGK